jgi:CBS domain-containing protein
MNMMQIMTPAPACCVPDDRLSDVAALMVEYDCGGIPVVESVESLKPIGVITDRDIACRAVTEGNSALEKTVADYMSSPCVAVTPEASVEDCCQILEKHRIRRVPVVDDDGILCGMVIPGRYRHPCADERSGAHAQNCLPTGSDVARLDRV